MVHITYHGNNDTGKSWNCYAENVRPFPLCNFISFPTPSNAQIILNHLLTSKQCHIFICTLAQLSPLPGMPALVAPKYILNFHYNSRLSFASSRRIYFEGVKEKKKIYVLLYCHWGCILYTPSLYDSSQCLAITHYLVIFLCFSFLEARTHAILSLYFSNIVPGK